VFDEERERGAPVNFGEGEGEGVQRRSRVGVGYPLVDLGRDEPLVRDDLAVLAMEPVPPFVSDVHQADLSKNAQVLGHLWLSQPGMERV
jgi:hypothetical protein